jgi:hypothetical protein
MFLDNSLMIADGLAHDGTPTVIDLGTASAAVGETIGIFIQGSADLAGCTGFVVTDGATDTAADALMTVTTDLVGTTRQVFLPTDKARYVKVDLVGTTSAGTWSCGVISLPVQTNM